MTVFEAVSDPTRRRVLELLAERDRTAGELASAFDVSRPAVSRHLRLLREAGLVHSRGEAQQRIYSLQRAPLAELDTWLRQFWTDALDRLERHLEREGR